MGFSYTYLGLCCDFCNNSGSKENVHKIACPFGWCQSWACCNVCYKDKKHLVNSCNGQSHKDYCKFKALDFDQERLKSVQASEFKKLEQNDFGSGLGGCTG